jgi:hypothetical protein
MVFATGARRRATRAVTLRRGRPSGIRAVRVSHTRPADDRKAQAQGDRPDAQPLIGLTTRLAAVRTPSTLCHRRDPLARPPLARHESPALSETLCNS